MLYDTWKTGIGTLQDHLDCFSRHSTSTWWYTHGAQGGRCLVDLDAFDAVAVHYSIRLCFPNWISDSWANAFERYEGAKILFIQDEYDNPSLSRDWIHRLAFDDVFTVVPTEHVARVYPSEIVGPSRFHSILTGYAPEAHEAPAPRTPPSRRPILIGYRGRRLPARYGHLARQKVEVGRIVREACEERNLAHDIEWEETKRLYGDAWPRFLAGCRTMLATESGSNVFDWDGTLQGRIDRATLLNPRMSYEEIHEAYIGDLEGEVEMNQISPKVFEAIAARTGLVLLEGRYSGILKPDRHYIPIRGDFSNLDEVLEKIDDGPAVDRMAERAFEEIIGTGRHGWRAFVGFVDERLEHTWREKAYAARHDLWSVPPTQDHLIPEERITRHPQVIDWSGRAGTVLGGIIRRFVPFSLRPAFRRVGTPVIMGWRRLVHRLPASKACLDRIGAGVMLVIAAVPMAMIALVIRSGMGRPVLFRQVRPGLHGRSFTLLKFRTMRVASNPEEDDALRLTRLGRFLRRWSLDELPTLWNVLRGEMSLVGPRPLLMEYLPLYSPEQARRHEVRPGITGWAQVNGRNAQTWEDRFRLDAWYVDHRSFTLDMRILLRTLGQVLLGRGISNEGHATMPRFRGAAS